MSIEIQEIGPERGSEFLSIIVGAMGDRIDEESVQRWQAIDEYVQQIGALDGERIVASAGSFDFDITVPGGSAPITGLTVVATLPTHRRRGIMRQLVEKHLRDARARGRVASALWASESQIYGRFGYGMAVYGCQIDIERTRARFLMPPADPGRVRLIDAAAAAERYPPIWDQARAEVPGMLTRSASWWGKRRLVDRGKSGGRLQYALLERGGRDAAYATYRLETEFDPRFGLSGGKLAVVEAVGRTAEDTLAMWHYLLNVDLVDRITCLFLPVDHPLAFALVDGRRLRQTVTDTVWMRPLDVQAALAARGYADHGAVTLAVKDALFPDNDGSYRIDGVSQTVERVTTEPDIDIDIHGLGAVYLGGFGFNQLVDAGRAHERRPGAAARASALFASARAPWTPEIF